MIFSKLANSQVTLYLIILIISFMAHLNYLLGLLGYYLLPHTHPLDKSPVSTGTLSYSLLCP